MSPQLIIAAIIAAIGFGGGCRVTSWYYQSQEKSRVEQQIADERLAAGRDRRSQEAVIAAQNEAQARARGLRVDATGARTALVGLHNAAEQALRDAEASQSACLERVNSFSQLLGTVATAGGVIAEKADRHANDAQTLIAAWPKE